MNVSEEYLLNMNKVRHAFDKAAGDYDNYSVLQRTVTDRLVESFDHLKINPSMILDLGSGTGYGSKKLKAIFRKACFYQLDLSCEMLKSSKTKNRSLFNKNHFLCADAYQLPFDENRFGLVFSSLMLQWCNSPDLVFNEVRRVLNPGGVFVFASFGPDTLKELRHSWQQVDQYNHTNAFFDMHDIGDALIRNGFDAPVLNTENIVLTYDDCMGLMQDLKKIGAQNLTAGRRTSLTGKSRLKKMINHYESYRQDNKLPATYEVVYGHAWYAEKKKSISANGSVSIPLSSLVDTLKTKK